MKFEKIKSTLFFAKGELGSFIVEKHKGLWWARFSSEHVNFKFPPQKSLKSAKELCENNYYWEWKKTI